MDEEAQFYTNFVHCDVKKDHPQGYDERIVQGFLPYDYINKIQNPSKEGLLNSLLTIVENPELEAYNTFQNAAANTRGSVQVNLFNKEKYTYAVFDRTDTPYSVEGIRQATISGVGDVELVKITDTSNHTDRIHNLWNQGESPILQVRTREVQMDPATKIAADARSVGNLDMFYVESKPPKNPTHIVYPPYNKSDNLSHFFCKYPVYVVYDGIQRDRYTLKVHLEYIKDGKTIIIKGDSNKAGIVFKILDKAKQCFSLNNIPDERIESGYIGKHSGDVLMVLSQFRDTFLNHVNDPNNIRNTKGKHIIFESSDTNAINKAFAVGTDCIWLHTNDKQRIIVFTKVTNEAEYLLKRAFTTLKSFLQQISMLGKVIVAIDKNLEKVKEILSNFKSYPVKGDNYVDILKEYTQYAVLYDRIKSIEKRKSKLEEVRRGANNIIERALSMFTTAEEWETQIKQKGYTPELYKEIISQLDPYDKAISPYLCLDIDISWANTIFRKNGSLSEIDISELTLLSNADPRKYEDVLKYDDVFKCVNLEVPGAEASRRISTNKTTSSWGLDIIHMTHDILKKIDESDSQEELSGAASSVAVPIRAEEFISSLYQSVPGNKKDKFIEVIQSVNINFQVNQSGGSRLYRNTYKKSKKGKMVRKTSKVYKQFGGSKEFINEIVEHINFMIALSSSKDTETDKSIFEEFGINIIENSSSASSASSASSTSSAAAPSEDSIVTLILDPISTYEVIAETLNSVEIKDALKRLFSINENSEEEERFVSINPTPERPKNSMGTERTETQERAFTQERIDSQFDNSKGVSLVTAIENAANAANSAEEGLSPPPKIPRTSPVAGESFGFAPPAFGDGVQLRQSSPKTVSSLSNTESSQPLSGSKRPRNNTNRRRASNRRKNSTLRANKRK